MSERRLIDTNVIVRYLADDAAATDGPAASRLFAKCDRGELVLVLLPAVLAECVFVLDSFYEFPRVKLAQGLAVVAASPNIEIEGRAIQLDALCRYSQTKLHFVDCVLAATAAANDMAVATFDKGLKKFSDVVVAVD